MLRPRSAFSSRTRRATTRTCRCAGSAGFSCRGRPLSSARWPAGGRRPRPPHHATAGRACNHTGVSPSHAAQPARAAVGRARHAEDINRRAGQASGDERAACQSDKVITSGQNRWPTPHQEDHGMVSGTIDENVVLASISDLAATHPGNDDLFADAAMRVRLARSAGVVRPDETSALHRSRSWTTVQLDVAPSRQRSSPTSPPTLACVTLNDSSTRPRDTRRADPCVAGRPNNPVNSAIADIRDRRVDGALQNDDGRGSVRGMRDRWRAEGSPSAKSELLKVDEIPRRTPNSGRSLEQASRRSEVALVVTALSPRRELVRRWDHPRPIQAPRACCSARRCPAPISHTARKRGRGRRRALRLRRHLAAVARAWPVRPATALESSPTRWTARRKRPALSRRCHGETLTSWICAPP